MLDGHATERCDVCDEPLNLGECGYCQDRADRIESAEYARVVKGAAPDPAAVVEARGVLHGGDYFGAPVRAWAEDVLRAQSRAS